MGQIFNALPRGLLAFIVLLGGILLIILANPPKSICDAQIDLFKKEQDSFLYQDKKSKAIKKTTQFERLFESCKGTNNPGGCFELFRHTKETLEGLNAVPKECRSEVASLAEAKKMINNMLELMIRLAWGERPPKTYAQKMGWLDVADISLYCQLKSRKIEFLGEASWNDLREKLLKTLPGAEGMARTQVWDFSILSENCERYP